MHTTMKSVIALAILGFASCQFQYNYNKFRPSPVDGTTNNNNNNYNPTNDYLYNLKLPNYQTSSSYQDFGNYYPPASKPNFNSYPYPPARPPINTYPYPPQFYPQPPIQRPIPNKPLFTPAQTPFPAESAGQLATYNKFLQQEAADAQRAQSESQFFTTGLFNSEDLGKSYVDVKFGGPSNLEYHYNV